MRHSVSMSGPDDSCRMQMTGAKPVPDKNTDLQSIAPFVSILMNF